MQSCHGLKVHDLDIIHRDFKPSNLVVTGTLHLLNVKVTDFDDMLIVKNTMTTIRTGNLFKGSTLSYTAGELCDRTAKCHSKTTDIYSWGMSAFEILSGLTSPWEKMFPTISDAFIIEALKNNERPDTNVLFDHYPKEHLSFILPIIEKC